MINKSWLVKAARKLCCKLFRKLHLFIIRAFVNRDTTLVLGRTKAGTLELRTDNFGLCGHVTINQSDQGALNLYELVKMRDVDQCSFGFDVKEKESEDEKK